MPASPEGYKHDDLLVSLDVSQKHLSISPSKSQIIDCLLLSWNWADRTCLAVPKGHLCRSSNRRESEQQAEGGHSTFYTTGLFHSTRQGQSEDSSPKEGKGMCQVIDPSRCPAGKRIRVWVWEQSWDCSQHRSGIQPWKLLCHSGSY